jgi:hypothetical protein
VIFTILISGVMSLLATIFSALPTLPAMSTTITGLTTSLMAFIETPLNVLKGLLGQSFFIAVSTLLIGLFAFEWIYHGIMWILRKIPILAIK